jgi:ferredoxin-NADP reductase
MTNHRKTHRQHAGELRVQARRQAPPQLSAMIGGVIRDEMSRQHVDYYGRLHYLPIGVTDASGRPWATVLCNPEIVALTSELLQVTAKVNPRDPFVQAVSGSSASQFAGVAIDFTSRSRIKIAGVVDAATLDGTTLTLALRANEHMGNCPKYITVRELQPTERTPQTTALGSKLTPLARDVVQQASTIFIATRHLDDDPRESDMGFNHRGGPKGFLRYFEDEHGAHLVLPDYSGNRFYQSLGNVETDAVIGLAVPEFASGALLQITGRARNLYDDAAARLMPGATLVTLISIDEAVVTTGALDLELVGPEQLSPYNPKVRVLASEAPSDRQSVEVTATLVGIASESRLISTFTFALPSPVDIVPGGHAIFDFSRQLQRDYRHMNDLDPQSLNDDNIRTFTVSKVSSDRRQISITVKKSGAISSYLHSLSAATPIEVELKGVGGTFTCFVPGREAPPMLWVAGGVGITPFLAMYRALRASGRPLPDIELFYACRLDEVELIRELTDIRVRVFDSKTTIAPPTTHLREVHRRRLRAADFDGLELLDRATVFVCGPEGFMADVKSWLEHVEPSRLRFESFQF